jgi:hypothetical protein
MFGVPCCRKEWGKALYDLVHGARIVGRGRGGGRETVNRKRKLSAVLRVLVVLYLRVTCMCRLRHINDPVLLSLKMEGIRFFVSVDICLPKWQPNSNQHFACKITSLLITNKHIKTLN